mmetsp:Transcript_35847/g.65098  ORF Transcript_35847/g.65098 Transcript_35847/m.65098 type:complete len:96 (-) Transcript_35847:50-337(-)|eukprot:CAMPEP_0197656266 /NCGR_PEP_ID=MMETSP1338-20131121/41080_1 /TAXON_ID=43686 ORGANISM="Pelagodinium beii, Strain RCC1491" /NCGR_SAMPLE_ID=MMETSP1338 /ASSEMBLY_ACC=CAM_ASM_000754 /LENGTH=95 /DNA_ID=CAMNT_0043232191 /DNA_START=33 /DNA_END=320 /DNA_ORIENTATION=-
MAKAVYYKLWASTAGWTQRSQYGWYQVWSRMAPWGLYVAAPAAGWYSFNWWSDEWKKTLTLGIYEPPLVHFDSNMTNLRSDFVKYHAQYPGIPYK